MTPAAIVQRMARQRRCTSHWTKKMPNGNRIAMSAAWANAAAGRSAVRHAIADSANARTLMLPRFRSNSTGYETHATAKVRNLIAGRTGSTAHPRASRPIRMNSHASVAPVGSKTVSATIAIASWGGYRYSPSYSPAAYRAAVSGTYTDAPAVIRRAASSYAAKS